MRQLRFAVIYGDTPKSAVLSDDGIENVAFSLQSTLTVRCRWREWNGFHRHRQQRTGSSCIMPHVISTPLSFLMRGALNSSIFVEPGYEYTILACRPRFKSP
ncbi:hypothetical protein [Sodalis-like endosymbiont of Proechinophthirus fluctus]|uniref:hypothetical protein n=1 Tax=Sodalis-like endosymbiont of Proechinophthirus fluctus TaxID=1462730 RepID=UPI0008323AFE